MIHFMLRSAGLKNIEIYFYANVQEHIYREDRKSVQELNILDHKFACS